MNEVRVVESMQSLTKALAQFVSMAGKCTRAEIVDLFIDDIVQGGDLCEQASVLGYVKPEGNEEAAVLRVLATSSSADSNARDIGRDTELSIQVSMTGLAFRNRKPEYAAEASKHPCYEPISEQDIGPMYCVPVTPTDLAEPFGVLSFHAPKGKEGFSPDQLVTMDIAVRCLEVVLARSSQRLSQAASA